MTLYSTNTINKYRAPVGDSRTDANKIEGLEREIFLLKSQLRREKNISALAKSNIFNNKNKNDIPGGIYIKSMNSIK